MHAEKFIIGIALFCATRTIDWNKPVFTASIIVIVSEIIIDRV